MDDCMIGSREPVERTPGETHEPGRNEEHLRSLNAKSEQP
jgi:hypothetical protein